MSLLHVAAIRGSTVFQADDAPHHSGPDFGKASPFGLLVVVLLLISVVFLVRSMNRHLRNLPGSFDTQQPAPGQATGKGSDSGDAARPDQPTQRQADRRFPDEPDG